MNKLNQIDINLEFPDLADNLYIDNIIAANTHENFLRKFIKPVDSKIKSNNLKEYLTDTPGNEKLQVYDLS